MSAANPDSEQWDMFVGEITNKERRAEEKKEERRRLRQLYATFTLEQLRSALADKMKGYVWVTEYHPGGMDGLQRVDIAGVDRSNDHFVLIEIEGGRTHPVVNVIKVWRYVEGTPDCPAVLLIQAFSPFSNEDNGQTPRRRAEAQFIGSKANKELQDRVAYKHVGENIWPADGSQLDNLVDAIDRHVTDYQTSRSQGPQEDRGTPS